MKSPCFRANRREIRRTPIKPLCLERLTEAGVDLVLSGHKHIPYSWRLENMLIVNAGTASTLRLRGDTRPCYNVIEVDDGRVSIFRKYPFKRRELAVYFDPNTQKYSRNSMWNDHVLEDAGGPLPRY
jgi:3',5'-cyclic-AMP phosphodiesterase